jgi:hypothetical protein
VAGGGSCVKALNAADSNCWIYLSSLVSVEIFREIIFVVYKNAHAPLHALNIVLTNDQNRPDYSGDESYLSRRYFLSHANRFSARQSFGKDVASF